MRTRDRVGTEVIVERHGHVQVVKLNRPHVKNALNAEVGRLVAAAIDDAEDSDAIRVSILTGNGGVFSSGMDMRAFLEGETPEVGKRGVCGITVKPPRKPLIGAVEGWALAAGLELLLACDVVVADVTACFGLPEVQRALVAGGGGALLLPRRVPFALAMEMLLTGDSVSAERAAAMGLINEVVPAGEALSRARELADRIADNGPLAVRATKMIARQSRDWSTTEMWNRQQLMTRSVLASQDAREGPRAFAEHRMPHWRGA
jgi:enoyl-CoA hydratase